MSDNTSSKKVIALGITGASGVQYSFRLLEQLLKADCKVYLMISKAAQVVIGMETELPLPGRASDIQKFLINKYGIYDPHIEHQRLEVFGEDEWTAPVASGSNNVNAMVVCPCSMGALSAIACGASNNLLERAADVVLKERKKLIIVPRETPYSDIHLENMLKLSRMDAVIVDANPGFYNQPKSVDDLVDFVVAKILDQLGVVHELQPRWGE
ncbi:MAG: UbiX family flavin prenyltransferase [Gammaproteobacteria bacterium]|nr:UbiX family flavin prenyltransferase [Gammaproteobacteria bacterium]